MIFGQLPVEPKNIAREIITAARSEASDASPAWTRAVKEALRRSGEDKGFDVYPSPARREKQGRPEWLLDLVWYNPTTGSVSLAVESEWGNEKAVLDDFSKLLVVKAPLKVMIFFAYQSSFVERFEKDYLAVFDHHVKGEQYLLVEFQGRKNDRVYLYEAPNDGKVSGGRFSELNLGTAIATASQCAWKG